MTPNAIWHCIDSATLSAGRKRRRRQQGVALSLSLLLVAALAVGCSL